jgi:hypothetical protein
MTRSLAAASRITLPLIKLEAARPPSKIRELGFTCFRLVPTSDGLVPVELARSSARMFVFVGR